MNMNEMIRKCNDIALCAARKRVSEQTGYLQHHYHIEGVPQAIPVFENFVFAYTLLKNKSAESIQKAKDLLSKLLHFQDTEEGMSQGNFPIYLHEYPQCKDGQLSINLLPVFYWILEQFNTVLGSELHEKMVQAARALIQHSLSAADQWSLPYTSQLKQASSVTAFGRYLKDQEYIEKGKFLLSEQSLYEPHFDWFSPIHLGDMLISLQLNHSSLINGSWHKFWQHLSNTYDPSLATYIGPCTYRFYWKKSPQLTVYDYFMAATGTVLPERLSSDSDSIVPLYASLIQPQQDTIPEITLPLSLNDSIEGDSWSVYRDPVFSVSTIDHTGDKHDSLWKGVLPMQLCWGSKDHLLSLVAQGGNYHKIKSSVEASTIKLDYNLSDTVDVDHKEEKKEVTLSLTKDESLKFFVNKGKSNTFQLGDTVEICSDTIKIALKFELIEGDGRFIGHIMPGNRASQLALKSSNRFNAYDWQLFLRTLTRTSRCRIRVNVTIQRTS
jgi:hypothetical protein